MNLLVRLEALRARLDEIADRIKAERKYVRRIIIPMRGEWGGYLRLLPQWLENLEEEIRGLWDEIWGEGERGSEKEEEQ